MSPVTCSMKLFATIVHGCNISICMLDVTGLVNRPLFILFQCFVAAQVFIVSVKKLQITITKSFLLPVQN